MKKSFEKIDIILYKFHKIMDPFIKSQLEAEGRIGKSGGLKFSGDSEKYIKNIRWEIKTVIFNTLWLLSSFIYLLYQYSKTIS